jgi:Pentapeptide repeats (8 copies)
MTDYSQLDNFTHQNLRNRSFRGKILNGADFSGADIRGCNFSNSQLAGANFQGAKIGISREKVVIFSGVVIAICLVFGDVLTRLILGTQGQVPESRSWSFVLLLYGVLSASGIVAAIGHVQPETLKLSRFARTISAILSGAVLGFFYAGIATNNNSLFALTGMVVGGVLMFFISLRIRHQIVKVAIAAAGSVATYGSAFLLSATASAFLNTHKLFWGACFSLLSLLYFWLTLVSFCGTVREIGNAIGTSFSGANLTDAKFDRPYQRE